MQDLHHTLPKNTCQFRFSSQKWKQKKRKEKRVQGDECRSLAPREFDKLSNVPPQLLDLMETKPQKKSKERFETSTNEKKKKYERKGYFFDMELSREQLLSSFFEELKTQP